MMHPLRPHQLCESIDEISASVERDGSKIEIEFRLVGDLEKVRWPDKASPDRITGLWHSTCFEAFIGPVNTSEYIEFNATPGGNWNAFFFDDTRTGMRETDELVLDRHEFTNTGRSALYFVQLTLNAFSDLPLRIGLSAVLEEKLESGNRSLHYFALTHRGDKPDFHRRDNHTLIHE